MRPDFLELQKRRYGREITGAGTFDTREQGCIMYSETVGWISRNHSKHARGETSPQIKAFHSISIYKNDAIQLQWIVFILGENTKKPSEPNWVNLNQWYKDKWF